MDEQETQIWNSVYAATYSSYRALKRSTSESCERGINEADRAVNALKRWRKQEDPNAGKITRVYKEEG